MNDNMSLNKKQPYLTAIGAWALAFGCAVGQGAFLMPGGTFLPSAGPVGTAIGIALGVLVMIVLARNYHLLMNRYPDGGGTYTYTKKCFGYDHGFLNAWFLILCYIAILWANAIGLPFIARSFFGSTFQFGFDYEIAGFHVWFGEILIVFAVLIIGALICLRRKLAENIMVIMSVLLIAGVAVCFIAAFFGKESGTAAFDPPFSSENSPAIGIFTIFTLAPWAFAGFESVSHSAGEAKFPLKKTFKILVIALVSAGAAYIMLALLSSMIQPEGASDWQEYVNGLGSTYSEGVSRHPPFFVSDAALGRLGRYLMGFAAMFGIFTGVIGNYIALSRLINNMAEDHMMPQWIGRTDKHDVPKNAILCILGISIVIPFFGRAAIGWIVDATTVGATIAYTFASAAALKTAKEEKSKSGMVFGIAGVVISMFFALAFLIPNLISVTTLTTESYLILAAWGLLGFIIFYTQLRKDKKRRLGRSNIALIVMLGLIIFTSTVWLRQSIDVSIEKSVKPIQDYYSEILEKHGIDTKTGATKSSDAYLRDVLNDVDGSLTRASTVQVALIVCTIVILFIIYAYIQRREKQIEVEKALAEETSRAKTSFLSNMSHEIRTPLNAIIGLDNIALRDQELTPRTREQLEKIGASAKHLLGLINDILDMSRIESGRMVLKTEEFLMRELIDQINIIINGQCLDKGLHYECQIVGGINDYYVGDDMKLKQVIINILGNSVKFTPAPGDVLFKIEQIKKEGDDCTLRFTMRDTGIGIDKEYISKIFEAFSQEDATTTNKYGGSGLGMAITKNFVEMMNGKIDVESEKGVGSTFTVTVNLKASERKYQPEAGMRLPEGLNAVVADDDAKRGGADDIIAKPLFSDSLMCRKNGADLAKEPDVPEEAGENVLAGKRVLMAEDVDANAEILADLLDLEEIESERAENGEIAVSMFLSKPAGYYDAVLMDVRMPVMDGLTATATIRANDREDAKTVPIIAMTANVFDEDVERSRQAGMNAHLSKPIEPDKLYAALVRFISENEKQKNI